jgi:hypothetical protein
MSEGVDLKKLREIARKHIEKAAAGDMQAIKELADRLDGKPAQQLEHDLPPDNDTAGETSLVQNAKLGGVDTKQTLTLSAETEWIRRQLRA